MRTLQVHLKGLMNLIVVISCTCLITKKQLLQLDYITMSTTSFVVNENV